MRAFFHDAAFVQHDEAVHGGDGGQAVGNRNHGFAVHHFVQAFLNGGFHFGIQRAGGFVQQQDGRVFQHHAGDGDALALATGKFHAAFADVRVITRAAFRVRQVGDEVGSFGAQSSLHHFFFGGFGAAVDNIVAHGAVQQAGVLRYQADLGAQRFLGNVVDVLPVDGNRATLRFVKTQQQIDDGGFARAAAAD